MGYIEQVLTGVSSERSLMNGHEALGVLGDRVDADEAALIKPVVARAAVRDALRANDFGGLEFGPGARGILKERRAGALIVPPKRERRRRGAAARRRGQPGRRSAVRGAAREAARRWRRRRACRRT